MCTSSEHSRMRVPVGKGRCGEHLHAGLEEHLPNAHTVPRAQLYATVARAQQPEHYGGEGHLNVRVHNAKLEHGLVRLGGQAVN
jgi:hypothetical protein